MQKAVINITLNIGREVRIKDFRGIQGGAIICVLGSPRERIVKAVNIIIHIMKWADSKLCSIYSCDVNRSL